MSKADYVRSQGQTRDHACHWPACPEQVPPAMWGCRPHWYALPKPIRDAIWDAYRPGQERTMTPNRDYVAAARAAQDWIAGHLAAQHLPPPAPAPGDHPLAGAPTTTCRWCTTRAPIVWAITAAGKRIPIEPTPNPAGNVEIHPTPNRNAAPFAVVHAGPPGMFDDWTPYMPHHATCKRDTPKGQQP